MSPISINAKGEALRGIWGVLGGLSTGGKLQLSKRYTRGSRSVYYKQIDETNCFFALGSMMSITNHINLSKCCFEKYQLFIL